MPGSRTASARTSARMDSHQSHVIGLRSNTPGQPVLAKRRAPLIWLPTGFGRLDIVDSTRHPRARLPRRHVIPSETGQGQDTSEYAVRIEMDPRELTRGRSVSRIVPLHSLEALYRRLGIRVGQQAQPHGDMPPETGILHHHGPSGSQIAAAAVAEPPTLPEGADRSHRTELPTRALNVSGDTRQRRRPFTR